MAASRILIVEDHEGQEPAPEIVQSALRLGAGYLLKSDAKELPAAIHAVLEGKKFVSDRLRVS
jgi:DNA-binding NarL/FixJ family response regulator